MDVEAALPPGGCWLAARGHFPRLAQGRAGPELLRKVPLRSGRWMALGGEADGGRAVLRASRRAWAKTCVTEEVRTGLQPLRGGFERGIRPKLFLEAGEEGFSGHSRACLLRLHLHWPLVCREGGGERGSGKDSETGIGDAEAKGVWL